MKKEIQMKSVTLEQFLEFKPCYSEERIRELAGNKVEWTALDVLALINISVEDKLWAVLRPEFIDEPILHEFACRCAEKALALINNPDPRSITAIKTKRAWIRGEVTDAELDAARAAARAAAWATAWDAAWATARGAAWAAQVEILIELLRI